jgi:hypothetical protein
MADIPAPQSISVKVDPGAQTPIKVPVSKLPAKLIAAMKQTQKPKQGKPDGWWNLSDFSGTLPGLLSFIDAAKDIPDHWKIAIKADAQAASAAGSNFFYLDAHYHIDRNRTLHYSLQPTTAKLT